MNIFSKAMAYKDGMKTLLEWTANSGELVPRETAEARAAVCEQCPLNDKHSTVAGAVADAIKRHLELKNHLGMKLPNEDKLHTCSACLCQNRLKVWLPIKFIYPNDEVKARLHPDCWLIK